MMEILMLFVTSYTGLYDIWLLRNWFWTQEIPQHNSSHHHPRSIRSTEICYRYNTTPYFNCFRELSTLLFTFGWVLSTFFAILSSELLPVSTPQEFWIYSVFWPKHVFEMCLLLLRGLSLQELQWQLSQFWPSGTGKHGCHQEFFLEGEARRFSYRLSLKPAKTIFTDHISAFRLVE